MSRIGKKPIAVPEKVEVKINGANVAVKGPKGQLNRDISNLVKVELKDKEVLVTPVNTARETRAMWGLSRTLIDNMVVGVTNGFTKSLEFTGVGYRAAVKGKSLTLNLGYSHPIEYPLPEGVEAKVDKTTITISGCSKELVGFAAAKIRTFRPPEPYKGKGIRYSDETILRKAGKSGAKK